MKKVVWPVGSDSFTIYPVKKKNGVKPIKTGLLASLRDEGWTIEAPAEFGGTRNPGHYDAMLQTAYGPVALEWETGNISSSHRSLNKMALALRKSLLAAGVLVVPTRILYNYLTDRVGNDQELEPYFELWRSISCKQGILTIVVIEHDATSLEVAPIPKGTDGWALISRSRDLLRRNRR